MPNGRLILIVDDEPTLIRGVQLRLQRAGFETIVAHDGRMALELARQRRPDLILMDFEMPIMDGITALGLLREQRETDGLPVIMNSGRESDRNEAIMAGASGFLSKPFSGNELVSLIDPLIRVRCASIGSG